jgi:hypothetical protein
MKRKFTPRQLQIIANYLQMPFVELVRYYNIGILNTPRLYELWQNALYKKGIAKRKAVHRW